MESQSKNKRVDLWVREKFPELSGRQIDEAIESGLVLSASGYKLKKGLKLEDARELRTELLEAHLIKIRLGNPALIVPLLEDHHDFVLVDKPPGIPSHPLSLFDDATITHWAMAKYPQVLEEFPDLQPTLVAHRLDTGTSGLLVVAKTRQGFAEWRERFQKKRIKKKYLAWCWGKPSDDEFEVNFSIGHSATDQRKMSIPARGEKSTAPIQDAQSLVKVLKRLRTRGAFLAEVECFSGVTHQVRVHLASKGFPLVGDDLYDLLVESRSYRPEFHQLRASELSTDGYVFKAPEAGFAGALTDL